MFIACVVPDVVLTAGKRDAKAVLRLERKYTSEINNAHVHQVTTGPYKGMLIDKAPGGRISMIQENDSCILHQKKTNYGQSN